VVVDLLWLRFSLLCSANGCRFRFPCTRDVQLETKGVTVGGLVSCIRFEFEVRRIDVQWNQTDTMRENFVLNHGSVVPDVSMFDGNRWHLVCDEEMKNFPEGEAERMYRTSTMSIIQKAFAMDASAVKLNRPLRQLVDLYYT